MSFLSGNFMKFIVGLGVVFIFVFAIACNQAGKTTFTKADFEKLRWLEGSWRGNDVSGQNPFYERYRFVGDAKIETESFSDATFSKVEHQSTTYFENGSIYHKSGDQLWTATRLDDSTIEFAPKEKAAGSFKWRKDSADLWTAWMGNMNETMYKMERIK